jgi:predicted outer membrane protein
MSALSKVKLGMLAAGLSCLLIGSAWAEREVEREYEGQSQAAQSQQSATQQARQQGQQYTAQYRGTQIGASQDEPIKAFLVACLLQKNRGEVELGKFAQQQSQDPQVKEFAQMLVRDHQKIVEQLEQLDHGQSAQSTTSTTTSQLDAQRQPADTTRLPGSSAAGQPARNQQDLGLTANRAGSQHDAAIQRLLQIDRQINERFGQAVREELQQKQGAEFDKCFVAGQIGAHMHSLAALEVLSQQGPEKLRQVAQQAEPTVRQHLEHAKQLMKQLEGSSTSQAERPLRTQR